jgi:hypothetical protein
VTNHTFLLRVSDNKNAYQDYVLQVEIKNSSIGYVPKFPVKPIPVPENETIVDPI